MEALPPPLIHPTALVETDRIGDGTRIWAFVHIMQDVTIGRKCNIGDHVFIESRVTIGDGVTVKNGVSIWEHVHIADNVFVGPNVTLTNDRFPRNPHTSYSAEEIWIEEGVSIGANATLLCGIRLGHHSFVGAGAVVTHSVPPHALVLGNPAVPRGWVCFCGRPLDVDDAGSAGCLACGKRWRVSNDGITELP